MYEKECKRNRIKVDDKGEDGKDIVLLKIERLRKKQKGNK
jgi:hypothetical protein